MISMLELGQVKANSQELLVGAENQELGASSAAHLGILQGAALEVEQMELKGGAYEM